MIKIAVIGDIHRFWDDADTAWFNSSDYDVVLFVGDLPGRSHLHMYEIAKKISGIEKPAYFIPGNHDGVSALQFIGELQQNHSLIERSAGKQSSRCEKLKKSLGHVVWCGYSIHPQRIRDTAFDLIACRPHSMGGPHAAFLPYLRETYGVSSMDESVGMLKSLVDRSESGTILFLAHNGPAGLGGRREDIWGCDFRKQGGDFGDRDLRATVEYARGTGRRVLGVAAGHMHHRLKGRGFRAESAEHEGILYINAARVPRIFHENGEVLHHHVRISTDGVQIAAQTLYVRPDGSIRIA